MKWIVLFLLCSCSPKGLGYRSHPLPAAYYPKRVKLAYGQLVIIDIQILKK